MERSYAWLPDFPQAPAQVTGSCAQRIQSSQGVARAFHGTRDGSTTSLFSGHAEDSQIVTIWAPITLDAPAETVRAPL